MSQYPNYNYNPNGVNYRNASPTGQPNPNGYNNNYPIQQSRPTQSPAQGYRPAPTQNGHVNHAPPQHGYQQQRPQQQYQRPPAQTFSSPTTQTLPQQSPTLYSASPQLSHQQTYSSPSQPQVIKPPPQRSSASQPQSFQVQNRQLQPQAWQIQQQQQQQQQNGGWVGNNQIAPTQGSYNQSYSPQQPYQTLPRLQQQQPGYASNYPSAPLPMIQSPHNQAFHQPRTVSPRVQVRIPPQPHKLSVNQAPSPMMPQQVTQPHVPTARPQGVVTKAVSQPPPPPPQVQQPVDYKVLLLSLAGEYIDAAHSIGPQAATNTNPEDTENYHKLVATALGCIEATRKNFQHTPRDEALLSLQYASLLHEETENGMEVDELLTRQIAKTGQAKIWDLKYTMQYLQIQALHRSKTKAALKLLDSIVLDITRLNHHPWIYAFRFLRISLSSQLLDQGHDVNAALQNALHIEAIAEKLEDDAVYVLTALIQAMLHLRVGNVQCYEESQRAIAKVRSRQLKLHRSLNHLWLLVDCVQATCHLMASNSVQIQQGIAALEKVAQTLENQDDNAIKWPADGVLLIPLRSGYDLHTTEFSNGIFQRNAAGRDLLRVSWMSRRNFTEMVQLLLGISERMKRSFSSEDGLASLNIAILGGADETQDVNGRILVDLPHSASLRSVAETSLQRRKIQCMLHIRAFMAHATSGDWDAASKHLQFLTVDSTKTASAQFQPWILFCTAAIKQGTGHLEEALAIYETPTFNLQAPSTSKSPTTRDDLSILATLHALIIRSSQNFDSAYLDRILQIESYIERYPSQSLRSAVHLTRTVLMDIQANSTSDTDPTKNSLSKRKLSLQESLNAAKFTGDSQLLALIMSLLTTMLFRGVLGDQASKMAKTASQLASTLGNPLLRSVADGLVMDYMEQQGDSREVLARSRKVVKAGLEKAPEMVRARIAAGIE